MVQISPVRGEFYERISKNVYARADFDGAHLSKPARLRGNEPYQGRRIRPTLQFEHVRFHRRRHTVAGGRGRLESYPGEKAGKGAGAGKNPRKVFFRV